MTRPSYPPVSPVSAAIRARCPRCGKGALFDGFLAVRQRCDVCGLDLSAHDAGDGPAVFVILILGALAVGLAIWVEATFEPAYWVHAVLWPPLILVLAIGMLRPLKAFLVAQQYTHRRETLNAE